MAALIGQSFMLALATAAGAARGVTRGSSGLAIVLAAVVVIAFGCLAIGLLARVARHSQQDDDGDSGSGGGGGPRRPTPPPRPGDDPVWWPEFERQFAAYVRNRSQEDSAVAVCRVFPTPARL